VCVVCVVFCYRYVACTVVVTRFRVYDAMVVYSFVSIYERVGG
jgi:hypothetical protein